MRELSSSSVSSLCATGGVRDSPKSASETRTMKGWSSVQYLNSKYGISAIVRDIMESPWLVDFLGCWIQVFGRACPPPRDFILQTEGWVDSGAQLRLSRGAYAWMETKFLKWFRCFERESENFNYVFPRLTWAERVWKIGSCNAASLKFQQLQPT